MCALQRALRLPPAPGLTNDLPHLDVDARAIQAGLQKNKDEALLAIGLASCTGVGGLLVTPDASPDQDGSGRGRGGRVVLGGLENAHQRRHRVAGYAEAEIHCGHWQRTAKVQGVKVTQRRNADNGQTTRLKLTYIAPK